MLLLAASAPCNTYLAYCIHSTADDVIKWLLITGQDLSLQGEYAMSSCLNVFHCQMTCWQPSWPGKPHITPSLTSPYYCTVALFSQAPCHVHRIWSHSHSTHLTTNSHLRQLRNCFIKNLFWLCIIYVCIIQWYIHIGLCVRWIYIDTVERT